MANGRVPHFYSLINQQIEFQENLNEFLSKAEAMLKVAFSNEFLDGSDEIKHNYLWALVDLIDHAKLINEQSLTILQETKPSYSEIHVN